MQSKLHKNSINNIVFLFAIGTILILPIIFFNYTNGATTENRNLALVPSLFNEGKINKVIFKELEEYVDDRFGLRDFLVNINNKISLSIFNVSSSDKVLLGKNKWLFYINKIDGNNLPDFLKTNKFTDNQLISIKNNIEDKADWCEKNGIKFMFVAPPNKHSIYPEFYSLDRPKGETRFDQLINYFRENSYIKIIDLRYDLLVAKEKALLYQETDTHWNNNGAYYGYKVVSEEVKNLFPAIDFGEEVQYRVGTFNNPGGDLSLMLGVKEYGPLTDFYYEPIGGYPYDTIKNDNDGVITEALNMDESILPKAIIFRDSFFGHLQPFVSSLFSKAIYNSQLFTEGDKDSILKEKPDIVIFEVVERRLNLLAQ
ncbi:hypothetical protein D4R87_01020 [bacterium]|nr:MAG: hypothetical protein D4R87_01020 [bacterium]